MNYSDYKESLKEIASFNCGSITCDCCALRVTSNYDEFYSEFKTGCMSVVAKRMFNIMENKQW